MMLRLKTLLIAIATSAALGGCAELSSLLPEAAAPTSARVVGIYVQLAPGLMMERNGSSAEAGLPLYAEVRTIAREGAPSRLVLIPLEGVKAGLGDTVEVALGERGAGLLTGPRAAQSRVVRVQAPAERTLVQRLTAQ